MTIILCETNIWKNIQELCWNKLIFEIVIGGYSNYERIKANGQELFIMSDRLDQAPFCYKKSDYLSSLYDVSQTEEEDTLFWNGSFLFDQALCCDFPMETCIVSPSGTWIACKTAHGAQYRDALLKEGISVLPLTILKTECPSIRSYEEVIQGVQKICQKDIDLYICTHPELIEIQDQVFVHPQAEIRYPVDFDASKGKIVIGKGTKITAFTLIEGPVLVAEECLITRALLRPYTAIGHHCRIAGEVSLTTIAPYSNKAHEGCVAVSHIGSWVNLGAGTECATLKYTYTPLSFSLPDRNIITSMIGCGTIFGDWVTLGVGTVLSPATILGLGATLHTPYQSVPKYVPPFSWGEKKWISEKWLETAQRRMGRRSLEFTKDKYLFYKYLIDNGGEK